MTNLEICLTSENVQSADAEARLSRAWRIIAEMTLQSEELEGQDNDHSEIPKNQKVKAS